MQQEETIRSMLKFIDPATLSYQEWIDVGMAIKSEGLPLEVWDDWSAKDERYHSGECALKWMSFKDTGITGATITHMAKERGWIGSKKEKIIRIIGMEDEVSADDYQITIDPTAPMVADPTEQMRMYLNALFDSDDTINIVTNATYKEDKDKWIPSGKGFNYPLKAILSFLNGGIDSFIGDRNKEAGVWIRVNPMDGQDVKNSNVTKFKHVLVESDSMPLDKQIEIYKRLELPISTLTLSGSKSVHALVKVDAEDADQYKERVKTIFKACTDQGLILDGQNKNPSRLTRLAGCERKGKEQSLLAINIGKNSFEEWVGTFEIDDLPEYESMEGIFDDPPKLPPETIKGVLRRGEKLVLTGPSKAGKSFALIGLAVALATGTYWMGRIPCTVQRVVYINMELTKENAAVRLLDVWKELRKKNTEGMSNLSIWNLRGSQITSKGMVDTIIRRHKSMSNPPDFYIIDPIYKINSGDENAAKDVNELLREFDRLCTETNANLVYAHHHAKGSQYGKRALDRGSGSGVIGRDADAAIDLDFLFVPEKICREKAEYYNDKSWMKATGLRVEMTLRNFENKPPFNIWFKYPVHKYDSSEEFQALKGESEKNSFDKAEDGKQRKKTATDDRIKSAIEDLIEEYGAAQMKDIEDVTGLTRKRIKQYIDSSNDFERNENGQVSRVGLSGKSQSHPDSD